MNQAQTLTGREIDTPSDSPSFIVVGLGASAGGIQALQEFFAHVPEHSGIAYVVILHLSPEHDSRLAEVLQTVTPLPVRQVLKKVQVEPDHIYVVPPNQHLEMQDGAILVTPNTQMGERRAPVDIFFRTLADSHGEAAVAVVLSGTGANGSMGLKRIKEHGGAVFVQNPREAEFNEMPRHAIATELVDDVLPVAAIPARIIAYKESRGRVEIPVEPEQRPDDQQQALREVFTQLRLRTGHDFTNYKRPTLLRRVERRINVRNLTSLSAYAAFLQQHPEETQALLKDLLISVTNFFRDQKAFETLEQDILPRIFQGKRSGDQVRIWVPGCATGEEAYSLAMLCAERVLGMIDAPKVQIFATDIDETAIAIARDGFYSSNDAADVSPERLRRFFLKEGEGFRIRREIRETALFAHHNLIKDPPFSHLDLVSCRNLLIYLNHTAQERVMETLHFALNPGGYLFLGTSESIDGASDIFTPVSREQHIYQSRQVSSRPYPVPESVPVFHFESSRPKTTAAEAEQRVLERLSYVDLHQRLLEQYAPPSVLINEEYELVHLSERAGRYLQMGGGEPSQNLLSLIRQELRLDLRAALYKAVQQRSNVEARDLKVRVEDHTETINLHVRPVWASGDTSRGYILVLFEPSTAPQSDELHLTATDEPMARQLEEELIRVKAQLRSSNEQHELQSEELKASNEELQAMNEELRSAAEELETSKEEMQSINEELHTVNQELKFKVEEVSLTSNNLQNLVNSSNIATIFLDRNFRVQLFSPTARELFNLIPTDYGRPLSDITHRLDYADLLNDAELVLAKLQTVEREVRAKDGRVYAMRVLPYRTAEDLISGVVVTFFDVTERTQVQEALRSSEERLHLLIESAKDYAIFTLDTERRVSSWNGGAEAMFGYSEQEILRQSADVLFVPEDRAKGEPEREARSARATGRAANERWLLRRDGARFYGSGLVNPLRSPEGAVIGFVKIMRDLTAQKVVEDALRVSEAKYRTLFDSINEGFHLTELLFDAAGRVVDYRFLEVNQAFERLTGLKHAAGKLGSQIAPQTEAYWLETYAQVLRTGEPLRIENYNQDTGRWYLASVARVGDSDSRQVGIIFDDVTARKRHEWRQDLILQVSDVLRSRSDAADILATVTQTVLEGYNVDRCFYCEIADGMAIIRREARRGNQPSVVGAYSLESFPLFQAAMESGHTLSVDNAPVSPELDEPLKLLCAQLQVVSFISAPVIKGGLYVGNLCIVQNTPRTWTEVEIALAEEIAERTCDTLERARAEAAMRQSEEKFRAFVSAVSDIIYEMSADWREMHFLQGKEFIATTEKPRRDWMEAYIPEDEKPRVWEAINQAIAAKTPFELEHRVIRLDGSLGWTFSRAIPRLDERGDIVKWFGAARDISERKRAEQALRDSEDRLRALIENLPGGAVFVVDCELRYVLAEGEALHAAGFTPADFVGKTIFEALSQELAAEYEPHYRRALNGELFVYEHASHGSTFISRGVPLRGAGGAINGVLVVSYDISERKMAEDELLRVQRELEQRVGERTAELNTANLQLRAVLAERLRAHQERAQLLRRLGLAQEEERRRIAREMHDQFGQMLTTLVLKLGLLKIEYAAQPELLAQLTILEQIARQLDTDIDFLVWQLRPTALDDLGLPQALTNYVENWSKHFGVPFEIHITGFDHDRLGNETETALYRIAQEALNNVIKHAEAAQVNLLLERRNQAVSMIIEDDGKGFDSALLANGDTRGVGLAGMRERALQLGGTVEIESQPGQGTTVIVQIPLSLTSPQTLTTAEENHD